MFRVTISTRPHLPAWSLLLGKAKRGCTCIKAFIPHNNPHKPTPTSSRPSIDGACHPNHIAGVRRRGTTTPHIVLWSRMASCSALFLASSRRYSPGVRRKWTSTVPWRIRFGTGDSVS